MLYSTVEGETICAVCVGGDGDSNGRSTKRDATTSFSAKKESKGARSEQPYTEEQKLQAMAEDNPALIKLQKIFKTRIIY